MSRTIVVKSHFRFIPFYRRYVAAMSRISALEMAFALMLDSPRYRRGARDGGKLQLALPRFAEPAAAGELLQESRALARRVTGSRSPYPIG